MQAYKLQNFAKDHPDRPFPAFKRMPADEVALHMARMAEWLKQVWNRESTFSVNANDAGFSLRRLPAFAALNPREPVAVIFYGDRSGVEMALDDLAAHFDDVRYPVSDDIVILDSTRTVAVFINHDGVVHSRGED